LFPCLLTFNLYSLVGTSEQMKKKTFSNTTILELLDTEMIHKGFWYILTNGDQYAESTVYKNKIGTS